MLLGVVLKWTSFQWRPPDVTSREWGSQVWYGGGSGDPRGWGQVQGRGGTKSDVQGGPGACTMRPNTSWVMVTWGLHVDRQWQTHTTEKLLFPIPLPGGSKLIQCNPIDITCSTFLYKNIVFIAFYDLAGQDHRKSIVSSNIIFTEINIQSW